LFFDHFSGFGYICAHRGARAIAPENTLLSARRCLELEADYWEFDVTKTADGKLVVFHDEVLSRTTDIADHPEFADREPWNIHDFTLAELRTLDAGSWFITADPDGAIASGFIRPDEFKYMRGQLIPTLEEALEFALRNDFPINVEIKDQPQLPGDLSIADDVFQLIQKKGVEDLVLISSFNHDYLARMHTIAPEIPLSVLVENEHPDDIIKYLHDLGAVGYHPDIKMTTSSLVRHLVDNGIRVSPYTINDMDLAMSMVNAGCFGITTDYTYALRQRLAKHD